MAITLANFQAFVQSVESSIANDVSGFKGFGSTLSADVGAFTVDVEKVFNWGLTAFSLSGNEEASVLAPIATFAEGIVNSIEAALGIGGSATMAPASVTAAAAAIAAGTSAAIPVAPAHAAPASPAPVPAAKSSFDTGDGTKVGDDPDAGAIGG